MTFDYSHKAYSRHNISDTTSALATTGRSSKPAFKKFEKQFDKRFTGFFPRDFPSFFGSLLKGSKTSRVSEHKQYSISDCPCYKQWAAERSENGNKKVFYPEDFSHFQSISRWESFRTYWPFDLVKLTKAAKKNVAILPSFIKSSLEEKVKTTKNKPLSSLEEIPVPLSFTLTSTQKDLKSDTLFTFDNITGVQHRYEATITRVSAALANSTSSLLSKSSTESLLTTADALLFHKNRATPKTYLPGDFNGLFNKWTSPKVKRTYYPGNFVGCSKWFTDSSYGVYLPGDFRGFYNKWASDSQDVKTDDFDDNSLSNDDLDTLVDSDAFVDDEEPPFMYYSHGEFDGYRHHWTSTSPCISIDEEVKVLDVGDKEFGPFVQASTQLTPKEPKVYLPGDFHFYKGLIKETDSYLPGDFLCYKDWIERPSLMELLNNFHFYQSMEKPRKGLLPTAFFVAYYILSLLRSMLWRQRVRPVVTKKTKNRVYLPKDFYFYQALIKEDTSKTYLPGDFLTYQNTIEEPPKRLSMQFNFGQKVASDTFNKHTQPIVDLNSNRSLAILFGVTPRDPAPVDDMTIESLSSKKPKGSLRGHNFKSTNLARLNEMEN